jgi:hypothetical protein
MEQSPSWEAEQFSQLTTNYYYYRHRRRRHNHNHQYQ